MLDMSFLIINFQEVKKKNFKKLTRFYQKQFLQWTGIILKKLQIFILKFPLNYERVNFNFKYR